MPVESNTTASKAVLKATEGSRGVYRKEPFKKLLPYHEAGGLLRHLRRYGCYLKREGAAHSLWVNPIIWSDRDNSTA